MAIKAPEAQILKKTAGKNIPHLLPALAALALVIALLAGGIFYARSVEQASVNDLAPARISLTNLGSTLQEAALRQSDLLPVYGSSEMYEEMDENSASQFFRTYPTGFTVFEVALSGITSIEIAQSLAALGPELKGKKVVISFTPSMFDSLAVGPTAYAGDFSRLHANEMIFSPILSLSLKQRAASRMLDYPDTLAEDPVLAFALQNLASHTPIDTLLYYLSLPIGRLQTEVIRLQDYWAVMSWINLNPQDVLPVERQTYPIDWNAEIVRARNLQRQLTSSNSYGIENSLLNLKKYQRILKTKVAPGSDDEFFIQKLSNSTEWEDLDILLSVLKETGAQPLILSRPLNGAMWNRMGVSASARQLFYDKLQKTVQPYGFSLIDFSDQDTNRLFSIDLSSHTSRLGWIYVDQALDAFYHGTIH